MNGIVIFYSWKGATERFARAISDALSIGYRRLEETKERRGIWGFITASLDALGDKCADLRNEAEDLELSSYDTVFIGGPVWASKPVPTLNTFLRDANLKGKKVVLFATYSQSGSQALFDNLAMKVEKCGASVSLRWSVLEKETLDPHFADRVKEMVKTLG
jgi:flavodoxin